MRIERFSIPSIFLISFLSFFFFLFSLPTLAASEADIKFPIPELGNCGSKPQCMAYCDKAENIVACTDFALRYNLLPAKEAERARQFAKTGFKGPGNCNSRQSCESFCDNPKNQEQCIEYAEKQGLISKEDAAIARRIPSDVKKPGGCKEAVECRMYCDNPDHIDECLAFAEKYNLMPKEEVREAREMVRRGLTSGPGGCKSKQICENYCSNPDHADECFEFAVKAGFIKPEEADMARKFMRSGFRGGPGGCRSKELCENYCRTPEHADECVDFAVKNGFMSPEEAEQARKFMRSGITSGPGGCRGMQECESYCENPDNMEACMDFAVKNGMMSAEDAERIKSGPRLPPGAQTPGNCKGDACREYCDNPDHEDECLEFAEKYNLAPQEDIERAREFEQHDDEFETDDRSASMRQQNLRGPDDFEDNDMRDDFDEETMRDDFRGDRGQDDFLNNDSENGFENDEFDDLIEPQSKAIQSRNKLVSKLRRLFETEGVGAQTSSTLPDFTITKATINGAALNFLYHNLGDGAAKAEVSFWYELIDGQGRRMGERYWLNVDGMAGKSKREAYQLLDSSTLQWERGQVKLGDLIYSSPQGAYHLKLTIDGPNAHKESNEQNNTVLLPLLRTDFTMTDAEFRNGLPSFKYHNRGNLGAREGKKVSFWFEWVNARGERVGDLHWLDVEPPSMLSPRSASLARSASFDSTTTVFSAKGATKLTAFLNLTPNDSTHLKITIDGPNTFAESNEGNNAVFLKKLYKLGSDLTVSNVVAKDRNLYVTVRNAGTADAPLTNLVLTWMGTDKVPMPYLLTASWTVDPISAGQERVEIISMDGLGQANKILREYPKEAARLRISADGDQRLVETDEKNNDFYMNRSELEAPTKSVTTPPPTITSPPVVAPPETTPKPSLGKLDLNLSTKIVRKDPKVSASGVGYPGDNVQATLDTKNTGEAKAIGVSLILNCPKGTSLKSTQLNGKAVKRDRAGNVAAPDLAKDKTHRLVVLCVIGNGAPAQSPLRFTASARMKGESKLFQSKTLQVIVWERAKAKPQEPKPESPKVPLPAPQPKPPEPLQAFPQQDLTTDSDFRF